MKLLLHTAALGMIAGALTIIIPPLPSAFADVDVMAQMGKRWHDTKEEPASKQSYAFAIHGRVPVNSMMQILGGPSLLTDFYKVDHSCNTQICHSGTFYKFGLDLGVAFELPLLTLSLYGRKILKSRGKQKVHGFVGVQETNSDGQIYSSTKGYDLITSLKFGLIDRLSFLLSFEMAYEKSRIEEDSHLHIRNMVGEAHLSHSLKTGWESKNSSALYLGLVYTL
jgi:hypothetical protein